ncbi:Dual-specificity lipid and protein phosphatase [Abortiporus biennis]
MTDFVRRLVSGNKARFKDGELDVDLDLVYITDHVIVMGYPAEGIEGLYRNRRDDAKKFLEHRHGKNFWVFNFCPVRENSYPASVFDGRVSRYPFPDHHAPPLAVLPLVAREMRVWLDGSSDRVAVLHCKAGKGRSGTMACSYLLSLEDAPRPPVMERSKSKHERATERAKELMDTMPTDDIVAAEARTNGDISDRDPIKQELSLDSHTSSSGPAAKAPTSNNLEHVLKLHTSRRMKRPSSPNKKVKPGVSIPSQRRWLYYWSLLLAHQGPPNFWPSELEAQEHKQVSPKVKIVEMKLRMRELSGVKSNLVKAANAVIDHTNLGKAAGMRINTTSHTKGQVWVSLARYDDDLVETLEQLERRSRSEDGNLGRRKKTYSGDDLRDMFSSDKWDNGKMVRSFARLGTIGNDSIQVETTNQKDKVITHRLRPLTGKNWDVLRQDIEQQKEALTNGGVASEEGSMYDLTKTLNTPGGVIVDANREVRAKLYFGQVFMGWFWFIPTFHMPHPRSSNQGSKTSWTLTRKELDFPLGVGSYIIDLELTMEWCSEAADVIAPPERQSSKESRAGEGEPAGVAATAEAITAGNISNAFEAKQAAED